MDSGLKALLPLIEFYKTGKNKIKAPELFNILNNFSEISVSAYYSELFFLKAKNILQKQKKEFLFNENNWLKSLKEKDYKAESIKYEANSEWWVKWGKRLNEL